MTHRIGGVILLRQDGSALLQQRDDKAGLTRAAQWVMPGGHCERGEMAEVCARREFLEETAYDCNDLFWLATFVDHEDSDAHCSMFWAWYDERQEVRCLEGQALKFVPRAQALAYEMPVILIDLWDMALAAAKVSLSSCDQDSSPPTTRFSN